jgi:hypothetical protein
VSRDYGTVTGSDYAGGGIGLGPRVALVESEPYPAPEVTSRQGITGPERKAVTDLVTLVARFGWQCQVTYARGCFPHSSHGTPGPVKDSLAVRLAHADGRRAVAVYAGVDGWAWDTLVASTDSAPWPQRFTSLAAFLDGLLGPMHQPIKADRPMEGPARRPLKVHGPLAP